MQLHCTVSLSCAQLKVYLYHNDVCDVNGYMKGSQHTLVTCSYWSEIHILKSCSWQHLIYTSYNSAT